MPVDLSIVGTAGELLPDALETCVNERYDKQMRKGDSETS